MASKTAVFVIQEGVGGDNEKTLIPMLVLMPQCRNADSADKVIQIRLRNVQLAPLAPGSLVGWWGFPCASVIK
jgi:hypothetical protein